MEKALSLPEIRKQIGYFLSTQDLKACMTVSKTWAESMAPWLWWSSAIQIRDYPASAETISKYAHHIRALDLNQAALCKDQYALFHSLQALDIKGALDSIPQDEMTALIQSNRSTLRSLTALGCHAIPVEVLQAIINSPALKSLTLLSMKFYDEKMVKDLLQTCTRLTQLRLSMVNWADWSLLWSTTQVFSHVEYLFIGHLDHPDQLGILRACPNLRSLLVALQNTIDFQEFAKALLPSCPRLETLLYDHPRVVTTQDLGQFLQDLPRMKCIQMGSTQDGVRFIPSPMSYAHHFSSLQAIMLSFFESCTSVDVQTLLCSCPNLRHIAGSQLYVQDINPETPWVCLGLVHFGVRLFENPDDLEHQTFVYSQLARLTQLRILSIGGRARSTVPPVKRVLGLYEGLGALSPLKRLFHLEIAGLSVDWQEEDIEWVIQEWPSLYSINGLLNGDEIRNNSLWKRLNSAGIYMKEHSYDFLDYTDTTTN